MTDIHELWRKVREHSDYIGGVIFTVHDLPNPDAEYIESPRYLESYLAEKGNDYIQMEFNDQDVQAGLGLGHYFSYTWKARLGGSFEPDDGVTSGQEGIDRAYDRLWDELQELVLRGTPADLKATFEIVVEECTDMGADDE